jgi:pantothenate kinase
MRPGVWERLAHSRLYLDQTETPLDVDRAQIETYYYPLSAELLDRCSSVPRLLVAVAGPPGCGKTAFATILVEVINLGAGEDVAVVVGLDGWHYPNGYLASHSAVRGGARIALRAIKGAPETFDAATAYASLSEMRQGGQVSFPIYSRRWHEPVPNAGLVEAFHTIVVVEGNYLLLDVDPWRQFRELFDLRVFISAPQETLMSSLMERHQRGGKTPEVTARQVREVDLPNARRVAPSAVYAHVLIHKADERYIDRVEWAGDWWGEKL